VALEHIPRHRRDIPSFSYQFSFEKRADWSRVYAPGRELKAYAEHCVDTYGLRSRIRLNTKVTGATFDDEHHFWRLAIADAPTVTARFVVGATGVFTQPKPPDIPGLDTFAGAVMHTARWDHEEDLRGRKVAIIGTGASAVQVIPSIAPQVEKLIVLQRTPIWCLSKPDKPLGPRARRLLGRVPGAQSAARALSQAYVELNFPLPAHFHGVVPLATGAERIGLRHLRRQVRDPVVREKLTPRYGLGCKRPSFSNEYLATFNRPTSYSRRLQSRRSPSPVCAPPTAASTTSTCSFLRPASRSSTRGTCPHLGFTAATESNSRSGGTRTGSRPMRE
jgi:cation diffusion facilitator CzcD-associated flavoprotein CzcO